MELKNKCRVCGAPCKSKYCKDCAKGAYRQNYKRIKVKFTGCDEDCAHCPYPDCLKPVKEIKTENISKREKEQETSQQKMYTVGVGGIRSKLW